MIHIYRSFTSIRYKLILIIGASTILVTSTLIAYTTKSARDQAIRAAEENAMANAKDYAGQVKTEIEKGLTSAQAIAQTFAATKTQTAPISIDREGALTIMREVLKQNESFYGMLTTWEPNAFDNKDESYKNYDAAHDSTGRFTPYLFKKQGQISIEKTEGYNQDNFYLVPQKTKNEVIIDPIPYLVNGNEIFLITLVAPVLNDNKFYGVAGVDIALDWMQRMVKNANLYKGKAHINIVANNGIIAASTIHDTLVGQEVKSIFTNDKEELNHIQQGVEGSILSDSALTVYAPITIGKTDTPWQISITIPSETILAEANTQMWYMISISTALLILCLLIILFVVHRIVKPLEHMVLATKKVAVGDLSDHGLHIQHVREDEIGQMSKAFIALIEGLRKTTDFANQIGQGNLEAEFHAFGDKDILGHALLSMRSNLKAVSEEDKKRNWTTEGLAKFGDILRKNNHDLTTLSEHVVVDLVKYLNANQGAIFSINEEDGEKYLELNATYAWNRKRMRSEKLALDDGLPGQAIREKDYIYLTDIPQNYIHITSGLGTANPTCVLVMPLMINEEVMGVIELASFKNLEQYQIDFVAKIGESIASTIATAKINQTTRALLEESRLVTEEKRAAEEELMQNQEELQATQEEMQRTIAELREENQRLHQELTSTSK